MLEVVEVIERTNGFPEGNEIVETRLGQMVLWEYVSGEFWLLFRRVVRKATWLQRMLGRIDEDVVIVTAIRHRPTPQELQSLQE